MSVAAFGISPDPQPYSAGILSKPSEIQKLCGKEISLAFSDAFSPELFLASIDERNWRPRVAAVYRGSTMVGIVYGKERKLAGVPTGLVYVDTTLSGLWLSNPALRNEVLSSASTALFRSRGVRGLRLAVPFHGMDLMSLRAVSERAVADFAFRNCHNHSVLPLPLTYEAFLESLSSLTRRNFRYYRRHFEAAGGKYVAKLGPEELAQAWDDLKTRSRIPSADRAVGRALRIAAIARRPLAVGLRGARGEWMSVLAGWLRGDRAIIFLQINRDVEYPKLSLSVVLRAYLVEALIASGIREIVFWAGAGGALYRYAAEIPTAFVYLDKPSPTWRAARRMISRFGERAPAEFKPLLSWISAPPEGFAEIPEVSPSEPSATSLLEHQF